MPVMTERPNPIDPALVSTLNKLTLGGTSGVGGTSNPRSARFADETALPPTILGSNAAVRGSSPSASSFEDRRRSPPVVLRDPEGVLLKFIEHLLAPEHSDSDPHLVAIGYELEALHSIYPGSVHLSVTSRPPSVDLVRDSIRDPVLNTVLPRASGLSLEPDIHTHINTAPAPSSSEVERSGSRDSQSWADAVFDASIWSPGERIRYEVTFPVWDEGDVLDGMERRNMPEQAPAMRVLVSLPPTYPNSSPPQLQLLGRYLGAFPIDAGLFGDITRTFITSSGTPFVPGDVCVFEGLTYVQTLARKWYAARLSEGLEGERTREAERRRGTQGRAMSAIPDDAMPRSSSSSFDHEGQQGRPPLHQLDQTAGDLDADGNPAPVPRRPSPRPTFSYSRDGDNAHKDKDGSTTPAALHAAEKGERPDFLIHVSTPIVDRKSTFMGHAVRVTDEREVPLVIHEILSDKKVAKAAHPAIFAYRIAKDVGGAAGKVYTSDCDDDGETAAGSRLAHLLEILEVENVLVVVTRWFGGIHLGPDRFKHINQAGRDALEVGGFLEGESGGGAGGAGKGKGRRR
ncbi:Protein IMPACT homolog [Saitozyma sp. JCM 24511]|nr:Protein IMPACT homolog [Saitozyma sp. JCM 24511]